MAKNPNKYGVGDVLLDILASASPGQRTSIGQAKRAGLPEAALQSPDIFKTLITERGKTERGEVYDPYKQGVLQLRAQGLKLDAEKLELQGKKAVADAAYRDKMLGYKKDWLSMSMKARAKTDPAFRSLSQAAIKALSLKDRTPEDEALIMSWREAMRKAGYDIEDIVDEPGFLDWAKGAISETFGSGKDKPKPAPAPKETPKSAPAKKGRVLVTRISDGREGYVSPGYDKTKYRTK